MLRKVNGLHRLTLHARDGEVGKVDEILFDDEQWTVRYFVVDTGVWLLGRKVLISPMVFGHSDWYGHTLNVNLTRKQIENSPGVETDRPVSRQWEREYYHYYNWPYYWGGMGGWGLYPYPKMLIDLPWGDEVSQQEIAEADLREREGDQDDPHLRSTKEVTSYQIAATDGPLGHVADFIVDDETWRISYIVVDTGDWLPGKRVLLPPEWIERVNWSDGSLTVNVTRAQVRNAPEWDTDHISRIFEEELYSYYARQHPWHREQVRFDALEKVGVTH